MLVEYCIATFIDAIKFSQISLINFGDLCKILS